MCTYTKCSLTLVLLCTLIVLNGGMVTFCVVWTGPQTLSRQNSFTSMVSPFGEQWITSFSTPVPYVPLWGSCSNPDMTAPKWACIQVMVTFTSSPLCYYSHGPIYKLGSNHNQNHLKIGHGWYNQQQHILIVILYPQDLEVNLHEPKVWDGKTPCPF